MPSSRPAGVSTESPREREILEVIYAAGPSTVADVRAQLSGSPGYSAVRTMLARLVEKGHLRHRRVGTRYVYSPTRTREVVSKGALRWVLNTYFGGSLAQAVTTLVGDGSTSLSAEEAAEIEACLAAVREERQ